MIKKISLICTAVIVTILFFTQASRAQSIKGKLTDAEDSPLKGATVAVKGSTFSTTSNDEGIFLLNDLKAGKQTVIISYVGLTATEIKVDLKEGQIHDLGTIELSNDSRLLQTVEITGRKEKTYKNDVSFIGSKTATALKDVPQSISYVTKELMQDQAISRVGEAVKNFSGVNQFTFYNDITMRGFRVYAGNGTMLVNGLRANASFWKQPPANYLERVEVIKGPVSALFGNASPGGTINRVTKKPLEQAKKSISFITGSFNSFRTLADFTGPLNDDKSLLYRLNVAYENAQSFRDLQFEKSIVVAPSVSFLPNEKTRLNFDLVYHKSNSRVDRGQSAFSDDLYSTPISLSLNAVNDYLKEETYNITTSFTHSFSNRTAFNMAYIRTGYSEDLFEHRNATTYAKDMLSSPVNFLVERQVFDRESKEFSDNLSAFLTHDFYTGQLKHKLVTGYDFAVSKLPVGASQLTASGYLKKDGTAASYKAADSAKFVTYSYKTTINGKDTTLILPKPNVPTYDLTKNDHRMEDITKYVYTPTSNTATIPHYNNLHGMYVQDQVSWGKWQLLLGLRYEIFTDKVNYTQSAGKKVSQYALLPRAGLVYAVKPNINVYALYTQGYNPQDAAVQSDTASGGPFDPLESNMVEAGIKTEWFNRRLTITTAVYRIEQRNTLYDAATADRPFLKTQIGKEESKGFEVDVAGQISANWNIVLNYAFNEAAITDAGKADLDIKGRQKPNAPKHQGNAWTKYNFSRGALKGLGIGIGANFVARRYVSLNKTQSIPGYEIANAALYYKVNRVQLQFNLNNIFNNTYWVGGYDYLRLFPGAPRNWLATVAYTF